LVLRGDIAWAKFRAGHHRNLILEIRHSDAIPAMDELQGWREIRA